MSNNDNTVNIKSRGARYHHGDLRAALIEEGLEQLSQRPADEVSLREIARNVGVSATAVYRHFPDKAALLAALCIIGDEKLSAAFRTAMEKAADARSAEAFGSGAFSSGEKTKTRKPISGTWDEHSDSDGRPRRRRGHDRA